MAGRKQFDPERALQAAVRVFWENGYLGTSIHDLESAMGVGRASIYSTYGDKEDLFLRALTSYVEQYGPPVREAFRIHADDSTLALRATFDAALARMSDTDLPAGCLIAQSASELLILGARPQEAVSQLLHGQLAIITAALETDRRSGRLAESADPNSLAAFLAGTIHSLSLLHRNGVGLDVLHRVAAHALSTLPTTTVASGT
ncbi:TetR/AcrR family transcriptional regulator [Rhodococcoides yunnanense]|nr:TetR/AcrR family transcriptional regulator [Rhodococcus yunnanensis]